MRSPHKFVLLVYFASWLVLLPDLSYAMTNGFTTVVEAGKVNCFYDDVDSNRTLEIEYQVRCYFQRNYLLVRMFIRNSSYAYF